MKLTQLFQTGRILRTLLIAAFTLLGTGALKAQNFFDNSIGGINLGNASGGNTGGHQTWAIFALSGGVSLTETTTDPYPIDVRGNIGIAGSGTLTMSATEVKGTAYGQNGSAISNSGGSFYDINTGTGVTAQTNLNTSQSGYVATAAANATAASAQALSAAGALINVGSSISLTGVAQTINAAATVNVINLTDIIMSGAGAILTLNGNSATNNTANYVINISRYLALSSGAQIVLGNGLKAQNVLFNVYNTAVAVGSIAANTANTQDVTLSGGAQLSGIILAPTRNVKLTGESTVFGEVIGKSVSLSGSSNVFNPLVSP